MQLLYQHGTLVDVVEFQLVLVEPQVTHFYGIGAREIQYLGEYDTLHADVDGLAAVVGDDGGLLVEVS